MHMKAMTTFPMPTPAKVIQLDKLKKFGENKTVKNVQIPIVLPKTLKLWSTFKQRAHFPHFHSTSLEVLTHRDFHDENWHSAKHKENCVYQKEGT